MFGDYQLTCFSKVLIGVIVIIVLFIVGVKCGNTSTEGSYDDPYSTEVATDSHFVSTKHIEAKNYFADHLKESMKDPKSYEQVSYSVVWNVPRKAYVVDLKFRGANSFGGKTIERWMGDVKFEGSTVSFDNVVKLE